MFRIVVAVYLMIVSVVGPAACCCTLTRLTDRLAQTQSDTSQPAPPQPAPASCCHHGHCHY